MVVLIKNEFIKLFKRAKTLVVFLGFLALLGFMVFASYKNEKFVLESEKPENRILSMQESLKYLEEDKERLKKDLKDKPEELELNLKRIDEDIKANKGSIEELKKEIKEKDKKIDWRVKLKADLKNTEANYNLQKKENNPDSEYLRMEIAKAKYLLENDIEPVGEYVLNGFNFLVGVLSNIGLSFLALGVVVFAADMVSGEYTPPTLKFLLIQPVARGKVLLAKYISLVVSAITLITSGELLFFIGISIFRGSGNFNYPVIQGMKFMYDKARVNPDGTFNIINVPNSASLMPMWKFVLIAILIQALYIMVACTLAFLISTIVKSSMISMAISVISIIMLQILNAIMGQSRGISKLLFITYGDPISLLEGNIARSMRNLSINLKSGIIVMLSWIIICYAISYFNFKKKDILI